jgi:hypothetical protein
MEPFFRREIIYLIQMANVHNPKTVLYILYSLIVQHNPIFLKGTIDDIAL